MKLKSHHWMLSTLLALAAHSVLFLVLLMTYASHGAKTEGENGIEINLGLLGDAGVTAVSTSTDKSPSKVRQTMDAKVEKTTITSPNTGLASKVTKPKKVEETPVKDTASITPTVHETAPPKNVAHTNDDTIPSGDASRHEPPAAEHPSDLWSPDQSSQLSKTTGSTNALNAGGQAGQHQDYLAKLVAQLTAHKHYPRLSRKRSEEGIAVLSVNISRTGKVLDYHIEKSSGFNALDKAVLAMLKSAQPFAPLPSEIKGEQISLKLPIAFQMDRS